MMKSLSKSLIHIINSHLFFVYLSFRHFLTLEIILRTCNTFRQNKHAPNSFRILSFGPLCWLHPARIEANQHLLGVLQSDATSCCNPMVIFSFICSFRRYLSIHIHTHIHIYICVIFDILCYKPLKLPAYSSAVEGAKA